MTTSRLPALLALLVAFIPMQAVMAQESGTRDADGKPARLQVPDTRLPIQALNTDLSMTLSRAPGVFAWTFDAAGWPNGLSAWGVDPNHGNLYWNEREIEDLLTGRPRFDMVPVALLSRAGWTGDGSASVQTDSLKTASPLTRVRYESAGDGLQAVSALHVQNRLLRTSDSTAVRLQTVFGYAGTATQGEYDGSQLKRGREVTARIGVTGQNWSAWIQDVASRRAVGAHAGVEPFTGAVYESIYQRLGATVTDPTARRRTIRNDLELGGKTTWHQWTGTLRAVRTSQTLDFRGSTLETRGWTTRWLLMPEISKPLRPGTLAVKGLILRDAGFGGSAWSTKPSGRTQTTLAASLNRSETWTLEAGVNNSSEHTWWHATASGSVRHRAVRIEGLLQRSARRPSLLERFGFGTGIDGLASSADIPLQESILARGGVHLLTGFWQLSLQASHLRESDAIIHRLGSSHTDLESRILPGIRTRSLVHLSAGLRDDGRKGLYVRLDGAVAASTGPNESMDALLWEESMPEAWAGGRLGLRALLFQDDLDLDLYIRGRVWDAMNGVRLHTPTGLLVLPADAATPVDQNWLVDIAAEGDVRGATLFFAYENMFSGTNLQTGNLLIPDYPLPRQRIRFGVYWPIAN